MASPTAATTALDLLGRVILSERGRLAALARREGLEPEDAVECVQDGLCTLLDRLGRDETVPAEARLRHTLATIVRNAARNRRRRHHRARPHLPIASVDLVSDTPSSDEWVVRAEEHVRLRACVAQLCETQRAVITLRLLEERHGEDVASTLGLTRGHVDVLLHRAKHSVRVCLTDQATRGS